MKGVQCYELFGGIVLKIHTFSFSFFINEQLHDLDYINNLAGLACLVGDMSIHFDNPL